MNLSTIVFDFGNVLGFFSHRRAAEQLAAYTDASPEAIISASSAHHGRSGPR